MLAKLKNIMEKEKQAVHRQLELLDKQNNLIMKNEAIKLEMVVEEIKLENKEIAQLEVEKRQVLAGHNLKELVFSSDDKELEDIFREMRKLVDLLRLQNETNSTLIRQQLSYTNKMLQILSPKKEAHTYNSYGNVRR